ncbi:hypothetical protein XELAEV_18042076mg [Xenopus laevis]|uniref:Uncharacterized protein n=1 Tax=Xenopus laevis TaxID=8355 RepID=A0A974C428_XENLA|nr:hypothetical protein XELAEV_18042076mg [Xenopus laevis]
MINYSTTTFLKKCPAPSMYKSLKSSNCWSLLSNGIGLRIIMIICHTTDLMGIILDDDIKKPACHKEGLGAV